MLLKLRAKVECDNCGNIYHAVVKEESRRVICDCDYPCGCFNGYTYTYTTKCEECGEEEVVLSYDTGR